MKPICLLALPALALSSAAGAQEIGLGVGASHFSGRFGGTERTQVDSVYLSANATSHGWRLDLTLPYLRVSGSGTIDIGGILVPIEGSGRSEGVGDLSVRVSRSLPRLPGLPLDISLAAQVKAPSGASAVSTQKADAGLEVELGREVGPLSPSLTVGYRMLGDLDYFPLRDGWSLSAGTGLSLGKVYLLASYEWSETAVTGTPNPQEVLLLAAGPLSRGWTWNLLATKGFSSGAADFGVGAGITRTFGRKPGRPVAPPRL
jgi:hypothetical protein